MEGRLLGSLALSLEVFKKYAGSDGDATTLSKKEIKTLVEKELCFLQREETGLQQKELDDLMKCWDQDGNGTVDYFEFSVMMSALAMILKPALECMCSQISVNKS